MSDTDTQEEQVEFVSKASPEQRKAAEAQGWVPPERLATLKNPPKTFLDADEFLQKVDEVLPMIRHQNRKLKDDVATLSRQAQETQQALAAALKKLESIDLEKSVETQKAVEKARREIQAELEAASEAGDHKAIARLTIDAADLAQAEKDAAAATEAAKKGNGDATRRPPPPDPEFEEWLADNEWFKTDRKKRLQFESIGRDLRMEGERSVGRAFMNKVADAWEETFGDTPEPPQRNRVAAARGSSTRSAGKSGYDALPADAKAACDADARRFVGENKRYKDTKSWRDAYASEYFRQEQK